MALSNLSASEIEAFHQKIRRLCNTARFDEAHLLAERLEKSYPNVLMFSYLGAVLIAEDTTGCTPAETERRYKAAAGKLRLLLKKMRAADPNLRSRITLAVVSPDGGDYTGVSLCCPCFILRRQSRASWKQVPFALELSYTTQATPFVCARFGGSKTLLPHVSV